MSYVIFPDPAIVTEVLTCSIALSPAEEYWPLLTGTNGSTIELMEIGIPGTTTAPESFPENYHTGMRLMGVDILSESLTAGQISWAELQVPLLAAVGQISWVEFQVPLDATLGFVDTRGVINIFQEAILAPAATPEQVAKIVMTSSGVNYLNANAIEIAVLHNPKATREPNDDAVCSANLGALTAYAGQFTTTRGFLSSDKYLQNEAYYNDYVYVIRGAESFDRYEHLFRKLVHPAGFQVLGEFVETIEADKNTPTTTWVAEDAIVATLGLTAGQISWAELIVPTAP